MTTVKEHYEQLLAKRYAWMTGSFEDLVAQNLTVLKELELEIPSEARVLDLGCGHGVQSVALANLGCAVTAVDSNNDLLAELQDQSKALSIATINDDIKNAGLYHPASYQLVVCCGDTLSHLDSFDDLYLVVANIFNALDTGGKAYVSFRDYSETLHDTSRFIPVRSDEERIMTCFLEYSPEFVRVTDIIHEKEAGEWKQYISSYRKLRLTISYMIELFEGVGFTVLTNKSINKMQHIVLQK